MKRIGLAAVFLLAAVPASQSDVVRPPMAYDIPGYAWSRSAAATESNALPDVINATLEVLVPVRTLEKK